MPLHTTTPPGATARSASGTSAPTGAKMIAASSGTGGVEVEGEAAGGLVARANESIDLTALVAGDLRHDVRGGAEAVEPEPVRIAGHAQRTVADEPGAEQRRRIDGGVRRGNGEAKARVGDGVLGIA